MSGLMVVAALGVVFVFLCVWPALIAAGRADASSGEGEGHTPNQGWKGER